MCRRRCRQLPGREEDSLYLVVGGPTDCVKQKNKGGRWDEGPGIQFQGLG